jgi:hypothetical protein
MIVIFYHYKLYHNSIDEICVFLRFCTVYSVNFILSFRTIYQFHLQGSRRKTHFLDFLTLENGTDKFSQNISMELSLYVAQNSRRSHLHDGRSLKSRKTHFVLRVGVAPWSWLTAKIFRRELFIYVCVCVYMDVQVVGFTKWIETTYFIDISGSNNLVQGMNKVTDWIHVI